MGLALANPAQATRISVKSHQKISDTAGGFTGVLDDSDFFGCSSALLGDLDGDGVTDIAVGARGDDDGGTNRGAVWILFLDPNGVVKNHQKISDTQGNFLGTLDDIDLFSAVSALGDLDDDGVTDIVVGASGDDDGGTARGAVWILFLKTDGTVKSYQKISDTAGGFTGVLDDDDQFGVSVADLGDLDNDSVTDIAVGAKRDDDGGNDGGAVWILFLNIDGTVKDHQKISNIYGGFSGTLDDFDYFGTSVSSVGDLDNDGVTDLAVGAETDDDGGNNRGALWILFLNTDGTVRDHQKISSTQGNFTGILDNSDKFGYAVASLGDLDYDGVPDIVVTAFSDDDGGYNRGAAWILLLDPNGLVKSHQKISDTEGGFRGILSDGDWFGASVTSIGDLDGDGLTDLLVGANADDDGDTDAGAVWVLFLGEPNDTPLVFHVDGVNGNDNNDGLSRQQALATIQFAIDATLDGDTVLVWPQTYREDINFMGKAITVKSAADAAHLVAAGSYAVSFINNEEPNSVLTNFVIRDSYAGVHAVGSSPTISQVTVVDNDHGIIADGGATPDISNSVFYNNANGDLIGCSADYSWLLENEEGLISCWKLDETSGSTASDCVGGNHGTVYGATWTTGQIYGALDFDGFNDYVDLGNTTNLKPPLPVSISAWIKLNDLGYHQGILRLDEEYETTRYGVSFQSSFDNKLVISYADGGWPSPPHRRTKKGDTIFTTDTWYHVVGVVRGPTDMDLYVDGIDDGGTYTGTGGDLAYSGTGHSYIARNPADYINGKIDDVRLYDRSLSVGQVEQIYADGLAGHSIVDPFFADPANNDYHLKSQKGRFWPQDPNDAGMFGELDGLWAMDGVTSPCIDAGDPNLAPTGEAMPNGGRVNMGAYGGTAYASRSEWPIEGDVNRDGIVNIVDFAILAGDWMATLPWVE